jgi:hypothetical protein
LLLSVRQRRRRWQHGRRRQTPRLASRCGPHPWRRNRW